MSNTLIHRYVQRHRPLVQSDPDAVHGALSRYSDLLRKADKWTSILMISSIVSALIGLAKLLGIELTAELYGQRLSDIPEMSFFAIALSGFLYLFGMIYGLNTVVYDSIIKWTSRELYGMNSGLLYRSWLGVQVFTELPSIFKEATPKSGERLAVFLLKVCWIIFILVGLCLLLFPLGTMIYFCILIGPSPSSVAIIEWWFTAVLIAVDAILLVMGLASLDIVTGED
jgi:hypothetical protein